MKKILVIEDDKDIADLLEMVLSDRYIVLAKRNATNIIEELTRFDPQLIIIDNQIGQRNATEIMEEIRAAGIFGHIPCVLFSASHDIENVAQTIQAAAFIAKPFDLIELHRCVDDVLNLKKILLTPNI